MKTKAKIITVILIVAIFALALFLRIYFSYGAVMADYSSGLVKYSPDDGVYHMRLVENELLGNHFPWRINFDPYTYFPYGTYIHFGPLYDFLLCLIIWLVSFGKPTLELINKIAPFYPAVMGGLVVFLVYLIGKKIWSNPIAILSAFLIAVMPPFLGRSLLGITDHHVAEVFFSSLFVLFLVYLITGPKKGKIFWLWTVLAGVSLGLYFLTWTGALLFLFITFCFISLYYLIRYLQGGNEEWILLSGGVIFLIALLMIAPFFGNPDFVTGRIYNIQHFLCFVAGILVFAVMGFLGNYLRKKNIKRYFLPVILLAGGMIVALALKFVAPFVWNIFIKTAMEVNSGMVDNKSARQFVGEMSPIRIRGAFNAFSALFYLSVVSLCVSLYKFIKEKKPEQFLLFIWTSIILFAVGIIPAFGQNRNSYYLSVIISLLASFIIIEGFKLGWQALRKADEFAERSYLRFYFYVSSVVILFNVIFFLFYPFPFNIDDPFPSNLPSFMQGAIGIAVSSPALSADWYDTLKWLKTNTPDPGVDYYSLYKASQPYKYPSQAYGILAQWDVGHDITYYSHRIPVSNPFQEGIGYINNDGTVQPGEGTFFLSTDEKKATGYLDELGAKYVIVDSGFSNPNGVFASYVRWVNANMDDYVGDNISETEPTKYDLAMSTRLYFLDGSLVSLPKTVEKNKVNLIIPALSSFRLVYESKSDNSIFWEQDYKTTKQVKVFEYVKGAKITGRTTPGSEVALSTEVSTNQKRDFIYQNEVVADENGNFEFVVPYSTGTQKNSDILAGGYLIKIGSYSKNIKVSEEDVLQGKILRIN